MSSKIAHVKHFLSFILKWPNIIIPFYSLDDIFTSHANDRMFQTNNNNNINNNQITLFAIFYLSHTHTHQVVVAVFRLLERENGAHVNFRTQPRDEQHPAPNPTSKKRDPLNDHHDWWVGARSFSCRHVWVATLDDVIYPHPPPRSLLPPLE